MPATVNGPALARQGTEDSENRHEHTQRDAQPGDDADPFGERDFSSGENELQAGSELFQRPALPAGFTTGESSGWPSEGEGHNRDGEQTDSADAGKVRWFGSRRRKNGAKQDSGGESGLDQPAVASSAETIPFPRSNPAAAYLSQESSDLNSLDQARAAVRSVFDSLGDQRPAGRTFNAPVVPQGEREQFSPGDTAPAVHSSAEDQPVENGWLNAGLEKRGFEAEPEQSGLNGGEGHEEEPRQWMKGWQADPATEEDDPDAQLRSALRAHFPGHGHAGRKTDAVASQYGQQTAQEELEGPESGEDEQPGWTPRALIRDRPDNQPPEPEDAFSEISEGDRSFDPRLFREIEETRELARHPRRRNGTGSLALAAAWGLFLCIAAGLIVGFVGFRDITAGALPGLVPLYHALGMQVTDQPLIFEGVQYEWTTPDNRPALNIKGAVYNRAQRGVKVPDFVITIKDGDPALDREYSAKLQVHGPKIRPEEHAEFEIELISPNPSITAVELELRSVR
jgi:hypothetical protein